jgi:hypothetical protein
MSLVSLLFHLFVLLKDQNELLETVFFITCDSLSNLSSVRVSEAKRKRNKDWSLGVLHLDNTKTWNNEKC